jgi:peptidoglycan hydrolase-like protein with peptidoglycan-binding domain
MTTQQVKEWQKILGIPVTGIFDKTTLEETKRWQTAHNVKATGVVTAETWQAAMKETP